MATRSRPKPCHWGSWQGSGADGLGTAQLRVGIGRSGWMDGARWGKQPLRGLDADRIPMVGPAYHGHSDFTRTLLHPCLIINSPRPFPAVAPLGPWPKWAHWSKGFWAPGPLGPWAPYPILSWANSPVAHGPKSPWTLVPKSAGAHGPMGPRAQGPRCSWGHEPVSRRAHGRMSPWAHSPRSITWLQPFAQLHD